LLIMAKKKRKKIDWERIEAEYRAGMLSIREIARRNDCNDRSIRKKAKKEGWERDLSKKVRQKVRSKVVRSQVRTAASEKEIIEEAATAGAQIIELHRVGIKNLRKLEEELTRELRDSPTKLYLSRYGGEIIEKEYGIIVTERISALQALANTMHKRIQLERQAYNLDEERDTINKTIAEMSDEELQLIARGRVGGD